MKSSLSDRLQLSVTKKGKPMGPGASKKLMDALVTK
jgi:hypothetical protein